LDGQLGLGDKQGRPVSFRRSLSNVLSGVRCLSPKEVLDLTNKLAPAATRGERDAQCLLGVLLCFHEAGEERMRALQEHDGCNCLMAAAEVGLLPKVFQRVSTEQLYKNVLGKIFLKSSQKTQKTKNVWA
jgi:hypothetical protein